MPNITTALTGKVIETCHADDKAKTLIVRTKCGHEAVIEWGPSGPILKSINTRIVVPGVDIHGKAHGGH